MSKNNLLDAMIAQAKLSKKQTEKQQRIVEAAIQMFAEKGYANTSTNEIAKAAGVAEGTIFRHYGTKDNLLLSIILPFIKDSFSNMAEELFNEIMPQNPPNFESFLRAFLLNRLDFLKENKEVFQIIIKEFFYNEELRKELSSIFSENAFSRLTKVIEMFQERGEFKDIPISKIQRLIATFVGGYFISRLFILPEGSIKDEEAEIEEVIRFVMDGLRNPQS